MFERAVLQTLKTWSTRSVRKPLVVRGARQVGKTFAVRMFGAGFGRFIEMNLEDRRNRDLFESDLSIQDLWQAILLESNPAHAAPLENTLLFIDEIQESPRAVQRLRFFYEQIPGLRVIAAGSLLEAMLTAEQISFPVGRVEYTFMRPLTFREFLVAMGEVQAVAAFDQVPHAKFAFPKLLDLFHRYTLIGGMPEAIERYVEHREIAALKAVYQNLLTSYLDDSAKYVQSQSKKAIMRHCIEQIPFEAASRITFNGFGNSAYRSREVGEALRTIERAMLITLIYPSTSTSIPIRPDFKKKPRLQFIDTGLVNYFVGLQGRFFEYDDLHGFYRGKLAEHIVGQELLGRANNTLEKLCFWVREKSQSRAEVDFLLQHEKWPLPVEVKAGKTGSLRSLHQFIDASHVPWAVRLYSGPLGIDSLKTPGGTPYRLLNLPYFLAGKLFDHLEWAVME